MNQLLKDKTLIFFVGLAFRLFLVVYIAVSNPYGWDFFNNAQYQGSDQADFAKLAQNIADHGVFSFADGSPFQPDNFRTPLFPYLAALSYWLTGGLWLYLFFNILISAGLGLIVYELSRQIFTSRRLALVSGLVFSLLPYGAYLSTMVMADNLFAFFFILTLLFTVKFLKAPIDLKNLLWAGAFLALTTLTRPITQYFLVLIITGLFLLKAPWKNKLLWAGLLILVFLMVSSPWLIRNYILFGQLNFSSLSGYHMFISWVGPYRAYFIDKISRDEEHGKLYQYIKDKYGKYGSEAMYDPVISEKLGQEAKKEILANLPVYLPFHLASGSVYFMNNDVLLTLNEVFGVKSGGIYMTEKLIKRDWSGFWRSLGRLNFVYILIYFVSYVWLAVKNLLALVALKKYWPVSPALVVLVLGAFVYFVLLVGPEGHARFRYPLEPLLLIFAFSIFLKNDAQINLYR